MGRKWKPDNLVQLWDKALMKVDLPVCRLSLSQFHIWTKTIYQTKLVAILEV